MSEDRVEYKTEQTNCQSKIERLVKTKTENIERVIGRFYIEYLKMKRAGISNKYGEMDGCTDGMDKLAYAVIKREES